MFGFLVTVVNVQNIPLNHHKKYQIINPKFCFIIITKNNWMLEFLTVHTGKRVLVGR